MLPGSALTKCVAGIDMDHPPKPLKFAAVSRVLVMARRAVSEELVRLAPCSHLLVAQPDGIPRLHRRGILVLVVALVRDRQELLEGLHQQIASPPASRARERKPRLMLGPSMPGRATEPHVGLVLLLAPEDSRRP